MKNLFKYTLNYFLFHSQTRPLDDVTCRKGGRLLRVFNPAGRWFFPCSPSAFYTRSSVNRHHSSPPLSPLLEPRSRRTSPPHSNGFHFTSN